MESNQSGKNTNSKIANLWIRLVAQLIDAVIIVLMLSLWAFYSEENLNAISIGLAGIIIIPWFYNSLFEGSKGGATIGKRLLKIKVINTENQKINFSIATIRFFLKYILGIIIVGWLMAFFNDEKQILHDKIAGTVVVKK